MPINSGTWPHLCVGWCSPPGFGSFHGCQVYDPEVHLYLTDVTSLKPMDSHFSIVNAMFPWDNHGQLCPWARDRNFFLSYVLLLEPRHETSQNIARPQERTEPLPELTGSKAKQRSIVMSRNYWCHPSCLSSIFTISVFTYWGLFLIPVSRGYASGIER